MSETKWTVEKFGTTNLPVVLDAEGRVICTVGGAEPWSIPQAEWAKNARLLAAAPDLFEALERLVRFAELRPVSDLNLNGATHSDIVGQARAALSKARGET